MTDEEMLLIAHTRAGPRYEQAVYNALSFAWDNSIPSIRLAVQLI